MGYAIDLRAPWHRAACGSSPSGPVENSDGGDLFVAIPDRSFRITDTGPNADFLSVTARANPTGKTYREWKSSEIGGSAGERIDDVTVAGRPALLITDGEGETFLVANDGYMYLVAHQVRNGNTAFVDRAAMIRSFRFLSASELRSARAAATPSPAPRSVEMVVDLLAQGFATADEGKLVRAMSPRCLSDGNYQDGVSSSDTQTYLESLRERFAHGLVVEVQARPITTRSEFPGTSFVRSTWREPGKTPLDVDLMVVVERGTGYWTGTLAFPGGRPP